MKKLMVLLVSVAFAADALAQGPAPDAAQGPVQLAQAGGSAGGAAQGATLPAASTGATSTIVAVVAAGAAAIASVVAYNSTSSSNH